MKTLFHLVSGQTAQILIAERTVKPDKNVLLYTAGSKNKLEIFNQIIKTEIAKIEISAYDIDTTTKLVEDYLNQNSNDEVIFNITGGTKLQSIALYNIAKVKKIQTIYVNSEENQLIYFNKNGSKSVLLNEVIITPQDYLSLHDQKFKSIEETKNISATSIKLSNFIFGNFFNTSFNKMILKYARNADIERKYIPLFEQKDGKLKGSTIAHKNKKSIIKFIFDDKLKYEAEEDGVSLIEDLCGKWFEKIVFLKLLKTGFFDSIGINLKIEWKDQKKTEFDKNEIDVFGIKGVYPFIFECKSGKVNAEAVYKLQALKQMNFGRYADLFIISFFPPSEAVMEKILEANIKYIPPSKSEAYFKNYKFPKPNL